MRAQAFIRRPRKIPWITLLLSTAAVALYLLPWAAAVFIFDRSALDQGQLWRLLTGHLVHLSAAHLIVDAAAFGIVAGAIERAGRPLGSLLFALTAGIGLFLWWRLPQMAVYGGLSGIGYGLLIYATLTLPGIRSRWRRPAQIAASMVALKVFLEIGMQTAWSPMPAQGFVPLPQSHAAGIAIALLYLAWEKVFRCPQPGQLDSMSEAGSETMSAGTLAARPTACLKPLPGLYDSLFCNRDG